MLWLPLTQLFTFALDYLLPLAFVPICDNDFEGGGWWLVRRVKQGTTWHPATDDLRGTDVYGLASYSAPGWDVSTATFSLEFASMITSETLFLIANGQFVLSQICL
jgi:hypothetical protein